MKKTVNINLASIVFTIDEDAYQLLKEYLDSISRHYAHTPDSGEIVADIEYSIAEQLNKDREATTPVTKEEIEGLITTMGRVEEFDAEYTEEAEYTQPSGETTQKRLYRSADDVVVGGVASGIAMYFGMDPVIARLLFVLFTFAWGFGIPLYIILWIITPEAKTPFEKAQMTGEPLTIKKIETEAKKIEGRVKQFVDDNKDVVNDKKVKGITRGVGNFFRTIFMYLGMFIQKFFPFIGKLIGIALALIASGAIIFLIVATVSFLVNRESAYIGFPIHEFISVSDFFVTVGAFAMTVLIPLIFFLLIGIGIIRRKSAITLTSVIVLGVLWTAAVSAAVSMGFKLAPTLETVRTELEKEMPTHTVTHDVQDFKTLLAHGNYNLTITTGEEYAVEVTATEEAHKALSLDVEGTELVITDAGRVQPCFFCRRDRADIRVTMPEVTKLTLLGAVRATTDTVTTEILTLDIAGASTLTTAIDVTELEASVVQASELIIEGTARQADITVRGAAEFAGRDFIVDTAKVYATGGSSLSIHVNNAISGETLGASRIRYYGNPATVDIVDHNAAVSEQHNLSLPEPEAPTSTPSQGEIE